MNILAACILSIALVLRAAPVCAAPVQTAAFVMMSDCEGAPKHHDGQPDQNGEDAARSCHACAFPPVAIAVLAQPASVIVIQSISASEQLTGGALKPPTPPPRGGGTQRLFNI